MNKTVLITGASRGIGRATAELFAANGYQVAINYMHSELEAFELARQLKKKGYTAVAYKADVADREQVDTMVAAISAEFGPIDCLVNNAGISQQKLFTDISFEDWNIMLGVNFSGVFHCCQAVLPQMILQHSGSIVNVSSIWGLVGASCEVHYSAVKAGVIGLTKALAKEMGPSGIRVNCVAPGVIETDMNKALSEKDIESLKDETPLMRLGTVNEVAECIYFLACEKAGFITGQVLSPNGGFVI